MRVEKHSCTGDHKLCLGRGCRLFNTLTSLNKPIKEARPHFFALTEHHTLGGVDATVVKKKAHVCLGPDEYQKFLKDAYDQISTDLDALGTGFQETDALTAAELEFWKVRQKSTFKLPRRFS